MLEKDKVVISIIVVSLDTNLKLKATINSIRKQLYNIGNSIIGDDKYYVKRGKDFIKSKNLMLHAYEIKFMINNVKYNFRANFNNEFKDFLSKKYLNIF